MDKVGRFPEALSVLTLCLNSFISEWFWSLQDFEPVRRGGDGERAQHLPQRAGPALLPGVLLGGPDQEGQGQDQEEEERKEVTDNAMQLFRIQEIN